VSSQHTRIVSISPSATILDISKSRWWNNYWRYFIYIYIYIYQTVVHITQVFGTGTPYEGMAYRIGRWFMALIKHCEKKHQHDITRMQSEFVQLWKYTVPHYLTTPCLEGCPCQRGIVDTSPPSGEPDSGFFAPINSSRFFRILDIKLHISLV
jgi:hypothetical protein